IRSLRIDDLNVEDLTEKEKEEAAARASAEAAAKARASQNSSGSGNSSGSNGSSQSSSGSASSGNTQSGNASQPASNPPPGSTAMYDAIKAQQDLTDSSMSLVKQGIATGNNTVYFIGLGGLVLAGVTPILLSGSGAGAILGGVFGGAAALTLILSPDDFSRKWFALKTNLGASYEQMPIVMNDKSGTSTDQAAYPMGSFGLKAIFFNNKAVSFSLQPYYSHGVNGIVKEHNATAWQYGFNSTLLMGKSSTAPVRFFLEGGWYNRHLADSNMTTGMAGVLDYSTLRYGLGFMLWTLNKKGTKEFYLKPGIFWERPSFLLTGQPAAVVGNLQLMLASILTIDISYGQNYFIGGTTTHALNTANGVNQNFFSIKLIKSTRLF
ncbi:MAG TPA: hypothetical protein VNW04_12245, partial [Puia sp.]|nr:hypothetical protein [Puia sp.]